MPIRSAGAIRQPISPAVLVAAEDLVAGLAGDLELPAQHFAVTFRAAANITVTSCGAYRGHCPRTSTHRGGRPGGLFRSGRGVSAPTLSILGAHGADAGRGGGDRTG